MSVSHFFTLIYSRWQIFRTLLHALRQALLSSLKRHTNQAEIKSCKLPLTDFQTSTKKGVNACIFFHEFVEKLRTSSFFIGNNHAMVLCSFQRIVENIQILICFHYYRRYRVYCVKFGILPKIKVVLHYMCPFSYILQAFFSQRFIYIHIGPDAGVTTFMLLFSLEN